MKKSFLLVLVVLIFSCSKKESTFQGNLIESDNGSWVYLQKVSLTDVITVDSCQIQNQQFFFNYEFDSVSFYRVLTDKNNFALMAIEQGDTIFFQSNAKSLFNYEASGNKDVEINTQLFSIINSVTPKTDSLRMVYQKAVGTKDENLVLERVRKKYDQIILENKTALKAFVDEHSQSFVSIIALQELGDVAEYIDYYKKVSDQLGERYPNNEWVKDLKKRIKAISNTALGAEAPDFSINDMKGQPFSLSSLRGSYVLIDFWASWCAPCRRENPLIVELYNEYKHKGLEIIGVSLDDTLNHKNGKQDWIKAIESDQLSWQQVSELHGFESSVCKDYGIESIPSTFLLDKNGIIIARNLRGTMLRNKLIEIFD